MNRQVSGDPHPWPRGRRVAASHCAVIVVDMQEDYCSPGYYMDRAGYDTRRLRAPIPRIQRVLAAARRSGLHVIYTRHGRPPAGDAGDAAFTDAYPRTAACGEPGWQIVPELRPAPGDMVIEKTAINAFAAGELDRLLRASGVRSLAFCGNTVDVCVHSTLRAAVDLGYECLLLGDCCGAVNDGLHAWAIESVKVENGVFGTVAGAAEFVDAFA